MYYNGQAVQQDYEAFAKWYRKMAEQGYVKAQSKLGLRLRFRGAGRDYKEAVKWYTKAAEQGHSLAQFNLAWMYDNGQGIEQDYKQAVKWYRKAAEQGLAEAQNNLGLMYYNGRGVAQDYKEAVKWFRMAAEQGHTEAQLVIGAVNFFGYGVPQDYTEAANWFRKAAEQGHAKAQYCLGLMYCDGQGVPQDYTEAANWFRKAAEQENATAQYSLALMYDNGHGVEQDYKEAVKWYTKAAEQENATAQYNLALMYSKGEGFPQDYKEAFKWFTKAAEQGYANAQLLLAVMYDNGEGIAQDYKEAFKWYNKAAEQENAQAQNNLGLMYYNGHGVIEDFIEAYKWTLLAGMNGWDVSQNKEVFKKQMTSYQIAEAQRLAKAFVPRPEMTGSKEGVLADDRLTPKSSGTGFFISSDGYVITAAHVVEGAVKIKVLTQAGLLPAKLHTKLVDEDVAVLKIDVKGYSALPIKSSRGVKIGAEVFTVGFPNIGLQGFEPKFTKGNISSLAGMQDDPKHFQISVPVQPGNSGGPLVDEWGNVVGVVVAKLNEKTTMELTGSLPQSVNYALKSSFTLALLESVWGIGNTMPEPHTKNKLSFENVVEKARNSVVLILVY